MGMSLVALHNGGGVGVSKSINGGFGLVLDGSKRVDEILQTSDDLGCHGRSRPT
jgi:urocanate hydratase